MSEQKKFERDPNKVDYIWVLGGGYLVYLGADLIHDLLTAQATHIALTAVASLAFIVVGGAVCLREWQVYRRAQKKQQEEALTEADEMPDGTVPEDEN